ncbi:hypothetical protein LCGC14_2268750, partial [marine sediment metagenome]
MADITIEALAYSGIYGIAARGGPFWTSTTVGYVIYSDNYADFKYKKTVDGGANWAGAVNIRTGAIFAYDCWADWQTPGDAGTKIHIVYIDADSDDVRYVYLDTSTDSVSGDRLIEAIQGTGALSASVGRRRQLTTITKARGGNLAVAMHYTDSALSMFYPFYTSPDGVTWTSRASPLEANIWEKALLFPGNEADNQDLWATYVDRSVSEISLKTYDNSGNSWSEQLLSANIIPTSIYLQMDGAIRLSDGHLIFAAWSEYDTSFADLLVWDINGAGSIVAKTNIFNNAP